MDARCVSGRGGDTFAAQQSQAAHEIRATPAFVTCMYERFPNRVADGLADAGVYSVYSEIGILPDELFTLSDSVRIFAAAR
jgi:hypothetical protein